MAGDGLLDAVAQSVDGAVELATHCAAALRDRSWVGDDELADQLEAAVGRGASTYVIKVHTTAIAMWSGS
jgi:hypothetical protein